MYRTWAEIDEKYMRLALEEAKLAFDKQEVPVGAVMVHEGEVVAAAHNLKESLIDPTAHAEVLVLREAARRLGRWRLKGTHLYVTMEPCSMCAGAMVQARVSRLVFAVRDPKAGACGSVFNISREPRLNHCIEISSGMLEEEVQNLLQEFFSGLRGKPGRAVNNGACVPLR